MPPLFSVKRGTPVVLALANQTPAPQPLHLHGHAFRMLHPFDDGWEPYWVDTLLIPENKTVRIAFDADNPGKWLLESMVAERFDAGLWTWFEVT
jgi:FtsP/CotA-like multicopper oxidase with cupredoxin domain